MSNKATRWLASVETQAVVEGNCVLRFVRFQWVFTVFESICVHIFNTAYLNPATPLVVSEAVSPNLQHPSFNLQHEIILFDKLTHERQRHTYSPMSERARAL